MNQFRATHPDVTFSIEWHPYQLSPDMARHEGRSVREHYARKFGEERMRSMIPYMQDIGKQEGIKFTYNGLVSNTVDSHRLALWAKQFGRQTEVVEEMFKDYFSNDKNIGDYQVLASAAERAGLDKNKVKSFFYIYEKDSNGELGPRVPEQRSRRRHYQKGSQQLASARYHWCASFHYRGKVSADIRMKRVAGM